MRNAFAIACIATLVAACTGTPEIQTGPDAETIEGTNLTRVDNTRAEMAYRDPQADFTGFKRVLIQPLGVDNIEVIQPSNSYSTVGRGNWELTEQDKTNLQNAFMDAMVKQLEDKGSFPIADEPGDDVLEIDAKLLAIAPNAPKDDFSSRPTGRSRVYTEGAGSMAVMVAFGDSETGEVLALIKDSRTATGFWGQNNSVSNLADVRRMFTSWATQINTGLERLQAEAN
ncbi:MAG: DUF3313 family protein [Pseudomonadota bacterium]